MLQITILQIDALKRVKKNFKILLLDKNGGTAKDIAKGLSSKGYKKVYVIQGGFGGWTSSKLQTRPSSSVSLYWPHNPIDHVKPRNQSNALHIWLVSQLAIITSTNVILILLCKQMPIYFTLCLRRKAFVSHKHQVDIFYCKANLKVFDLCFSRVESLHTRSGRGSRPPKAK